MEPCKGIIKLDNYKLQIRKAINADIEIENITKHN